jgi:uncharacterized LabA/DUF88 family protein
MELAPHIDQMVLFSGDGDFTPLVGAMQRKGVKVSVVSTVTSNPPMVADDLRRQCDEFIDLAHLMPRIGRDPGDKSDRGTRPVPAGAAAGNPALERRYGIRRDEE